MTLQRHSSWQSRLTLLLAGVAVPCSAFAQQDNVKLDQAKAAMASGITAAQKGDLAAAQNAFSNAVFLAPQVSATHAALGSVLLEQGEIDRADKELTTAHALAPSDIATDLNLARAEVAKARYITALALFQLALSDSSRPELSPAEAIAYATALDATGDASTAQTTLTNALAAAPNSAQLHDALGTLFAQQADLSHALPHFQQAVTLEPANTLAQYHLGTTLLALNHPDEAIAPLQLAAKADPNSFDFQLQFGRTLSTLGRDEEALIELHRAAQLSASVTNVQSLYALALALQASGDAAAALPLFAAATSDPKAWKPADYSSALINVALAHVQTGDAKGAVQLYEKALAVGPDSPTLREDFGAAYLQQQELDHAISQFKAGLALDASSAHLHYDLGLALKLKDNLAAAIPEFERAAALDPSLPDPAFTLGVIYMQQGKFAESAAQLKHAVELQPANGDAWALLGSTLRDSGDTAGAMDALKHAVTLQPGQPNLHIEIAALESQAGQKEEAAAERKLAADLSRAVVSHQRASFALKSGKALLAQNKLDDALVQLNTATQADPKSADAHQLLAEVYARQGKAADAALERSRAAELAAPVK
jgi:protein O-GlcNAc transferase